MTTPKTEPRVYFIKNGDKFHYSQDCQPLRRARGRLTGVVFEAELSEACASGRTACTRCCPGIHNREEVTP